MSLSQKIEPLFLRMPHGFMSRLRIAFYRSLGMKLGRNNRIEGGGRVRRCAQIAIGNQNAFSQGCWLWPADNFFAGTRIRIGDDNYFNRNVMLDACGLIEIGAENQFGPDIYITDSNHRFGANIVGKREGMDIGRVRIGNGCWIGAKAVILKDVELGDRCVVGAGAVVTRSFPADSVIAGVPARSITKRTVPGTHALTVENPT